MRRAFSKCILSIILLLCAGCSSTQDFADSEIEEVTETFTPSINNTVSLNDIKAPNVREFLCILKQEQWHDVTYATGYEYVLDIMSGFPGFGYSVIITGPSFTEDDSVFICTDYGEYKYELIDSFIYDSNKIRNGVYDSKIFKLGLECENLFLCDCENGQVYEYKLVDTTLITL